MREMRGGEENYTVPYTAFCLTYSVTLYSYIVSPYITIIHNNDYALRYRVTLYNYIVSPYIFAALYTGGGVRGGDCLAFSSFPPFALRLCSPPSRAVRLLLNVLANRDKSAHKFHCPPPFSFAFHLLSIFTCATITKRHFSYYSYILLFYFILYRTEYRITFLR